MSFALQSLEYPAITNRRQKNIANLLQVRCLGRVSSLINTLCTEFKRNVARFREICRSCSAREAFTLALVKLMDYSDHLPTALSPTPTVLSSNRSEWIVRLMDPCLQRLELACACMIDWRFDSNVIAEVAYNASLGESEVHPHIVHAFKKQVGDTQILFIRYFDDESTVWRGNPCRASTVTLSEICIDVERLKLRSLRYHRFRSPKRRKYNRGETLEELHRLLENEAEFSRISHKQVTFGVNVTNASCEVVCRFAMQPTSFFRRIFTSLIVQAQLSIVFAILKENIAFVRLATGGYLALRQRENPFSQSSRSSVLKERYGRKELRIRLRGQRDF